MNTNIIVQYDYLAPQSIRTFDQIFIQPKMKSTIGIHNPLGLRYLFQLTVDLSPLRSHKRRHNFSDTPPEICECNLCIQNIRHFLFECPTHATQRLTPAVRVIDILQRNNLNHLGNQPELYLYGQPSLDFIDNRPRDENKPPSILLPR